MGTFMKYFRTEKDGVVGSFELQNQKLPTVDDPRWEINGTISKIHIYPAKSCGAVSPSSGQVKIQKYGLEFNGVMKDRQFLIVDEHNNLVTGRQLPKLVLVQPWIENGILSLSAPEVPTFNLELPKSSEGYEIVETKVCRQSCHGVDLGREVGQWFSNFLERPDRVFKLIYHLENDSNRELFDGNDPYNPMMRKEDVPLYADDNPIMLATTASLDALNIALEAKNVDKIENYKQLRPCILVEGASKAWDEDNWLYLMINGSILRNVRLCGRCVFTTVDPDNGKKRSDGEPLKTLKEIRMSSDEDVRKAHNAPYFGILLAIDHPGGVIKEGDKIFVITKDKVKLSSPMLSILIQTILMGSIALFSYSLIKKFK